MYGKCWYKEERMRTLVRLFFGLTLSGITVWSAFAQEGRKFEFKDEASGKESKVFGSIVGMWHIDKDGSKHVYAVDGRSGQGLLSQKAGENATAFFGEKSSEFLRHIAAYKEFPLTICRGYESFRNGTLILSFKAVSGKDDQAAGIAFHIREKGEYLAIRANALENNLVLFKFEKGKRSSLQWIDKVPPPTGGWHTLKVAIKGKKIEGFLDDRKYIDYEHNEPISGRIGLWSKADSYVFFDNFIVEQKTGKRR
jgi:hypothetical protein